jgi:uncharacterized protein (DUF169 family)
MQTHGIGQMSHGQQQQLSARKTLKWTSIKFLPRVPGDLTLLPTQDIRFCEAVSRVTEAEWILTPDSVCCAGALRCLGWLKGADQELARRLAERMDTSASMAQKAIADVPVLPQTFEAVWVGTDTEPDVYVSYLLPERAMQIVRSWQRIFGKSLPIQVSGIMAVCGSAVVNSYVNHTISLTFGCPDSRQYGGIRPEQLVVAIPADLMTKMNNLIEGFDTRRATGQE